MSSLKAGASFAIALALTSLLVPSDGCGAPKKRKRSAGHDIVEDNGDLLGVFKKQEEYHYLVEGAKGLSSDRLKAVYDLMQKEQPKSELKTKIADEIKTMKDPEIVRKITRFASFASPEPSVHL